MTKKDAIRILNEGLEENFVSGSEPADTGRRQMVSVAVPPPLPTPELQEPVNGPAFDGV